MEITPSTVLQTLCTNFILKHKKIWGKIRITGELGFVTLYKELEFVHNCIHISKPV